METLKKLLLSLLLVLPFFACASLYAQDIPSIDEIWYEASSKLPETTDYYSEGCLHTDAFNTTIASHTFFKGKGVIKFDGNVTSIGDNAFNECHTLFSITLPNSVKSIGSSAFSGCDYLESVNIPNAVGSIYDYAFQGCRSLTSITIPKSVTFIGDEPFCGCYFTSEEFVNFSNFSSSEFGAELCNIQEDGLCYYFSYDVGYVCGYRGHPISITIPSSIKYINRYVFAHCKTLKSVKISYGLECIYENAFYNCSELTSIEIPNSVKRIDELAFALCTSLTSINIPYYATSLASNIFSGCKFTKKEFINNSSLDAAASNYWGAKIYDVIQEDGLCINGKTAKSFRGNPIIINIPNTVTTIETSALNWCGISSVVIPKSLLTINNYAFQCPNLKTVYCFAEQVPQMGSCVFDYVNLSDATLFVPKGTLNNYKSADQWKDFGTILEFSPENIPNNEIWYTSTDGIVVKPNKADGFGAEITYNVTSGENGIIHFNGDVSCIGNSAFSGGCTNLASIVLPQTVNAINNAGFSACYSLKSIYLPNTLLSIGNVAFERCAFSSFTIPNSVTSIGDFAFYECTNLSSIFIPKSVETIGLAPFDRCSSLDTIEVEIENNVYDSRDKCNALIETSTNKLISGCKNTIIPNTVTSIEEDAFYGYDIISINIPNSVTSIGKSAFASCAHLTSCVIPKSVVNIGWGAFFNCSELKTFYCYAEQPPMTGDEWKSGVDIFQNIDLSNAMLYVPQSSTDSYKATFPWSSFGTIIEMTPNVSVIDQYGDKTSIILKSGDDIFLSDNIKSIEITDTIPSVNLTYTRNFSDAMVGNWQAWYMPCDFDYEDLSNDFDVAEIEGALISSTGETYIAFSKMTGGTVKAHTPYVVRAKEAGDAVVTTTTTLQPTVNAKSFAIQTAKKNFTFGGVYENSYLSAEQPTYALNKSGNFAMMGETVYLRPFRIYMRITDREDNPYAAVTTPKEVKVVVLGEDETSIENVDADVDVDGEIYNLAGQKLQKLQKGINIVNGKKVLF